jgi:acyl-coenzyme A thioesterase PaaI-like protein
MDRADAFASRLAARNNFFQRIASLIWLPYAFKSGIRMKRIDASTFSAILPFRRFNRNWYNAMAGAALLANSEVAGGMYVFGICGGDYEVVCKHLEYKFLRPCFGPALYRINPREDVKALAATGGEFNVTLDMDIVQQLGKPGSKDRRVGKCVVTFHVTPKTHQKAKGRKS